LVEVIRWKLSVLDESIDFAGAATDREYGVELMHHEEGRDIRLLEVDAASAARHDPDVAAGITSLYLERHERIREASADLDDPDTAAWFMAALAAGIGMKEAAGLSKPDAHRLNVILVAALSHLPGSE
jgi:hypothetical protein